jgi:hypothetical protein
MSDLGTTPFQYQMFKVEKQIEFDDIEMGVLNDGTPYLTGRGLERVCGVSHGQFHRFVTDWDNERFKPRGRTIQQLLDAQNYQSDSLFLRANYNGIEVLAFTEPVCIAVLEYYAFYASDKKEKALNVYRILARSKFREFVYQAVGYIPSSTDNWKQFHDRVSLTYASVPVGYFSIFKEIADMIVTIGQQGIYINPSFVPDISVGKGWAQYWKTNNLSDKYGEFLEYEHNYPSYFPQAKSNPQPVKCYPEDALGEFRRWFRNVYVGEGKLRKYINKKVLDLSLPSEFADNALAEYEKLLLPG